jgi:uncharacterized DUF497 family protein
MRFEFDSVKDEINRAKHGVSLALGMLILEGKVAEVIDPRHEDASPSDRPTVAST